MITGGIMSEIDRFWDSFASMTSLVATLVACGSDRPAPEPPTERLIADTPSQVLTDSSAGPGHELNGISSALRLSDGRILLANAGIPELTLCDAAGGFPGAVGRKGQGPGEWSGTGSTV